MEIKNIIRVLLISIVVVSCILGWAQSGDVDVDNNGSTNHHSYMSDQEIVQRIKDQIKENKLISDSKVEITSQQGQVNLSGKVNTRKEASALIEIAESTSGVSDVDAASLVIKGSKHPFDDAAITAKVKGIFIREKLFGDMNTAPMTIHVETKNGEVFLTGKADDAEQISTAVSLAQSVKGVKKVNSKIIITK